MGVFKRFGDVVHQHTALFGETAEDVIPGAEEIDLCEYLRPRRSV
jgi:hypothetical protein